MKLLLHLAIFALTLSFVQAQDTAFGRQSSSEEIRHSFLITGSKTAIIDEDSKIIWEVTGRSRDGSVLENGNVLVTIGKTANEYAKGTQRVVWSYTLSPENKELGTSVRLDNGNTLIVERGVKPRLLEVDPAGKIAVEVPLQPETDNGHMQTRMARKLPNGNYLVPHLLAFAVKEYTSTGEIVNTIHTDLEEFGGRPKKNWPFTAIRLENGNTLVNLTHGNRIAEFTPDGKVAWTLSNSDVDGRFADPCGGQRLPNGNTIVCSYGQKAPDKSKVFEVDREGNVVWDYFNPKLRGIHEIHVLTTNGKAIPHPPLK